ncbi:hypothetical protein GCM10010532_090580 [Dactylosporangium siamense]|uniref:Uncharacterized protein n=1 Tax=Dactylosporangium siamense TaxID=685454 RepID=A0A919UDM6_9ACTN|nr:hypothetical protein Dsi01nite_096680 [Dactylosporangium siamense]
MQVSFRKDPTGIVGRHGAGGRAPRVPAHVTRDTTPRRGCGKQTFERHPVGGPAVGYRGLDVRGEARA